jgi:hypothetical protein
MFLTRKRIMLEAMGGDGRGDGDSPRRFLAAIALRQYSRPMATWTLFIGR